VWLRLVISTAFTEGIKPFSSTLRGWQKLKAVKLCSFALSHNRKNFLNDTKRQPG
jgi:hypothetical protein